VEDVKELSQQQSDEAKGGIVLSLLLMFGWCAVPVYIIVGRCSGKNERKGTIDCCCIVINLSLYS